MKGFFKEHFVLIAGLALPLILSAIFFISANVPVNMIDPPRYTAVFAYDYYYRNSPEYPYKIEVNDEGFLDFHYFPTSDDNRRNWNVPGVYTFDPKTKKAERVNLPQIKDFKSESVLPIPELEGKKIDTSLTSPDGFSFEQDYRGNGNLMTEIFGGGHSGGYRYYFVKDGRRFPIKLESGMYLGDGSLVGWIVEDKNP